MQKYKCNGKLLKDNSIYYIHKEYGFRISLKELKSLVFEHKEQGATQEITFIKEPTWSEYSDNNIIVIPEKLTYTLDQILLGDDFNIVYTEMYIEKGGGK